MLMQFLMILFLNATPKKPKFYNLKYHEYILNLHCNNKKFYGVIYNGLNGTFTCADNLINDAILTKYDGGGCNPEHYLENN